MKYDRKIIASMVTGMAIGAVLVSEAAAGIVAEPTWQKIYVDGQQVSMTAYNIAGHNFATHALSSGVDAKTLSGILGHTKASFTLDTYTHVTGDMQQRAADIVGGFMTDFFGEELKPWQSAENGAQEAST